MTTIDKNQIMDELRSFIKKKFRPRVDPMSLSSTDNLQESVIDSIDTIQIILHVEATYGIQVSQFEGTHFDTLERIANLVVSKRS